MATFKVGMRVKKVDYYYLDHLNDAIPLGAEGVIVGVSDDSRYHWLIDYPGYIPGSWPTFYATSQMLAPIVDDSEWASSAVKKLVEKCQPTPSELAANRIRDRK